jgi:curved DNA-binding protein CbpA
MKDYYKILEINFDADITEVKKAYRRLAMQYHPDKNKAPDAAQRFIEITEAYEVLCDTSKKAYYDNIYKEYFFSKQTTSHSDTSYQEKQQTWTDIGRQKAKEYSNMSYDDFSKRILDELKLGAGYLPNIFTIGFVLLGGIGMFTLLPKAFNEGGGMGIFILAMIVGLGFLVYHL